MQHVEPASLDAHSVIGDVSAVPAAPVSRGEHSYDVQWAANAALISGLAYKANDERLAKQLSHFGKVYATFDSKSQRGLVCAGENSIWVVFEGSNFFSTSDYIENLNHTHVPHGLAGHTHNGFTRRMNEEVSGNAMHKFRYPRRMIEAVHEQILHYAAIYPEAKIHFVGHSSGGASTMLQAAYFAQKSPDLARQRVANITTFGQPRVGDKSFVDAFTQIYPTCYERYVLSEDLIPALPPTYKLPYRAEGYYTHGGTEHTLSPVKLSLPPRPSSHSHTAGISRHLMHVTNGIKQLPHRGYHMLRGRHGMAAYMEACLRPERISAKQFVKQFLFDKHTALSKDTLLQNEWDYLIHTVDLVEYLQQKQTSAPLREKLSHMHASFLQLARSEENKKACAITFSGMAAVFSLALQNDAATNDDVAALRDHLDCVYASSAIFNPTETKLEALAYALKPSQVTFQNPDDQATAEIYGQEMRTLLASTTPAEKTSLQYLLGNIHKLCTNDAHPTPEQLFVAKLSEECINELKMQKRTAPSLSR